MAATGAVTEVGVAAATITAGEVVYKDASNSNYGIALNHASLNQPLTVQKTGVINFGATVAVGTVYVTSGAVAGNIAPTADLVSGWYSTIIGIGITAANILLDITVPSPPVAVP